MRTGGGFGTVTLRDVVVTTALPNNTMNLLAVRHRNGRDFWLLTRNLRSRTFVAYLLSASGLAAVPITSPPPTAETPYPLGIFLNFRASPDGQQLFAPGAISALGADGKYVLQAVNALYQFDNATGLVSNERVIYTGSIGPFPGPLADIGKYNCLSIHTNCISACFSPSGRMLYTIETILPPDNYHRNSICQYDLTQSTPAAIQTSRLVLAQAPTQFLLDRSTLSRFADLQLAPDGTIWVGDLIHRNLQRSPTALIDVQPKAVSIIRHPDVVGLGCQLDLLAYPLPGRVGASQFPNIVTNMLYPATALEAQVSCTDSARFWPNSAQTGPPGRWDFGDPSSGAANATTGYYVAHRYARGGTYQVTLTYPNGRHLRRTLLVPAGPADLSSANVFTPNGDGQNDVFQLVLQGTLADNARLQVFSRWGRLLYEAVSTAPAWDGAGAAAGQYLYQLDYLDCQGQPQHQRGWVELIK
jgi:gliding motility-associated-like protein